VRGAPFPAAARPTPAGRGQGSGCCQVRARSAGVGALPPPRGGRARGSGEGGPHTHPLLLVLVAAALGCGAARPRAAPVAGSLVFSCEPADARVSIDETELGPCALWAGRAVALGPGTHRVVVSREGYLPLESEVVPTGRRVTVRAALRRVPE